MTVKGFKGFDTSFRCRGFQFAVGQAYTTASAKICEEGFHFCDNPFDVFNYYPPASSRYAEVEGDGATDRSSDDSKIVCTELKIGEEIGLEGLILAGIKSVMREVKWESAATSAGDRSAVTNTGDQSAATSTGYRSAATSTGYRSTATNTGDRSVATSTADQSTATSTGGRSAATSTGYRSAATNTGDQSAATSTGDQSAATNMGYRSAATNMGYRSAATCRVPFRTGFGNPGCG